MKYAFINANVIDGRLNCELQENMTILVDDNKISKIGRNLDTKEYKVIDLKGKYIMPGLINLHAHLFGTGKPSKSLSGGKSQKRILNFIKTPLGMKILDNMVYNHCKNALNSGCTTIRGVGDFLYSDVRIRDKIESSTKKTPIGPRLFVSGPAITIKGGHGEGTFSETSNDIEDLKKFTLSRIQNGTNLIKICVTGGVMDSKVKGEYGKLRMNYEQTKAITDIAHEHKYLVASHTESLEGVKIALKANVDTIEHGSMLDEEAIELYKKTNSRLVLTLSPAIPLALLSPDITMLDEVAQYNSNELLNSLIQGAKTALENDIVVGLGTDVSCPFAAPYNMWMELVYFTKYIGVSNSFAIHTATEVNAKILQIDDHIGTIQEGKLADMIVLEKNPLEDLHALKNVNMVMVNGKLLKKPHVKRNKKIENELKNLL